MVEDSRQDPAKVKQSPKVPTIRCGPDGVIGAAESVGFNTINDEARADAHILDESRLVAFVTREEPHLKVKQLTGKLYSSIEEFVRNIDVLENELIMHHHLSAPFREIVTSFDERLNAYRFLTYGKLIALAVAELKKSEVFAAAHGAIKHLIVDEYQARILIPPRSH